MYQNTVCLFLKTGNLHRVYCPSSLIVSCFSLCIWRNRQWKNKQAKKKKNHNIITTCRNVHDLVLCKWVRTEEECKPHSSFLLSSVKLVFVVSKNTKLNKEFYLKTSFSFLSFYVAVHPEPLRSSDQLLHTVGLSVWSSPSAATFKSWLKTHLRAALSLCNNL